MRTKLQLNAEDFTTLLDQLGPSLGLWRAAEVAALRTRSFQAPVLDLGCGDGLVTSLVLPRVDIGVDPWPPAIRRAAARGLYARLEAKPIERVEVTPGSIGTIVSNSVLEHIADLPLVLRTAARLLRCGGQLIFTVPTEAFATWLALPFARYGAWRNGHYEHRNLWSIDQWAHKLRQAGLTIVSVQPYLRRSLVMAWDALDLPQRVWIGRYRLFGLFWRRLPSAALERLAHYFAALDLSAPPPGGGRLIVAQRCRE